jgi:hypothetical protein
MGEWESDLDKCWCCFSQKCTVVVFIYMYVFRDVLSMSSIVHVMLDGPCHRQPPHVTALLLLFVSSPPVLLLRYSKNEDIFPMFEFNAYGYGILQIRTDQVSRPLYHVAY